MGYLQDFCGYSYFRKPIAQMQRKEDIFWNDKSKLGMMRRVFAGRYIPILIILAILILPNLVETIPELRCRCAYIVSAVFDLVCNLCVGRRVFCLSVLEV